MIRLALVALQESWARICANWNFDCERMHLLSSLYLWLSVGVYLGDWGFDLISKRYDSTLDYLPALSVTS